MSAKILSGKKVAEKILADLKSRLRRLKSKGITPGLAVILVGDDPASIKYVQKKQKMAENLGIDFHLYEMLPTVKEYQLIKLIRDLNQSKAIQGILVQLPLPKNLSIQKILDSINPKKDIDGLGSKSFYCSATATGIIKILEFYRIPIKNKQTVILGKGILVGQPLAKIMSQKGAKVENLDIKTFNVEKIRTADILVAATGQSDLIKAEMVKKGAVVIDCGAPNSEVDFNKVKKKAKAITPVPGGVGPVTVVNLFANLIQAVEKYNINLNLNT